METKTWAYIPGYEGLYYVTSDGIVYNKKGKPLKYRKKHKKNYSVVLFKNGKHEEKSINTIMRMCFFDGKPGCMMHKDGSALNFSLRNLKLVTQSEISKRNRGSNQRPVIYTKPDGTEIVYGSTAEAARALYVSSSAIQRYCQKKCKTQEIKGDFRYET